jgi:Xaa-Pro aminopeptidase
MLVLCLAAATAAAAQAGSPAGPVPVELLAQRRSRFLADMRTGVAVIRSADIRSDRDYPQDSDYRENNDFFYLTGLESPGSWLVLIHHPEQPQVRLYVPASGGAHEQWTGRRPGPGPATQKLTGIDDVRPADRAEREIAKLVQENRTLWLEREPPGSSRCRAASARMAGCAPVIERLGIETDVRPRDVSDITAALRLVKDADELRRLRRAMDITAEAHREAMHFAAPGRFEYEIEAVIEFTIRRMGAERVGFPSIVASGPNSTILHYDKNRRRTEDGDLVVVDIGAEFGYYSADVTRTIPVSGKYSDRQRAIYGLVLGAQQAAIDAIKPGVTTSELNQVARDYIDRNSGTLCGRGSCDRFFVHSLAHWLGMDVHDVGDYGTPLAPGMVLTIEPGIYIADEGLGVRIEDDVLVTAAGAELLSGTAPRTAEDVERWMAQARVTVDGRARQPSPPFD